MTAPVRDSIDALLDDDPRALDDDELKQHIKALVRSRSSVNAALFAAVGEMDARNAHVSDGATDATAWVAHHTGTARSVAGSMVWLTKRLRYMPLFAQAMAEGAITAEHARVMAHELNPRTLEMFVRDEGMLVGHARQLEVDDFALVVARWKLFADPDGPDPGNEKPSEWHVSEMLAGRRRVDGELDFEDSVEYTAELDRLYEEIWKADHSDSASDAERNRTRSQRYAAAQVVMARRSANASDERQPKRKPLFVVNIDLPALVGDPGGDARLSDGTPVGWEFIERWRCDAGLGRVVMLGGSVPVDLGKVTYIATSGQRRVLEVRDRGCIVPGCNRPPKWCQVHHVVKWPDGATDINNLVLLCHRHHKQVHKGIIKVLRGDRAGTFVVTKFDGTPIYQRPPPTLNAA